MSQFTHLHTHSHYSVLDGAASVNKLIDRAVAIGQTALSITDHGNMYGVREFQLAAKKKGIKPILGCEVYVAPVSRLDKSVRGADHLILLAKNREGYHNLIKLVSYGFTEGFYYNPRIDKELLTKYSEGLICSSACLGGEIPGFIMDGDDTKTREAIEFYKNLFGEDFYLEMQMHPSGNPHIDAKVFHNQMLVNKKLAAYAAEYGIKYIATNDVHYAAEDDAAAHDRLICLSTGKDLDDPNRMRYTTQEWLKSYDEMFALFGEDYPDALSNTQEIVDKVEEYDLTEKPFMPNFPLPDDFVVDDKRVASDVAKDVDTDPEEATNKARQQQYLEHIAREGAEERYGKPLPHDAEERLMFELGTVEKMGFPGYFLIVWDFIRAGREMGVSVGPGRGSAAGSVVAYCLGITNIDPLKYGLLFERFLNPERISMPDIDIDFDEDGREKVMQYVVHKYGQRRVAQIVTFGTMAAKSSIRDVGRIQKLDLRETDRLAKMVPDAPGTSLEEAYKEVPELNDERSSENPLIHDTLLFAEKLEGTVRQTGVHACGVIIGKDDLENYAPLATAKDAELYVVQYEGKLVEDVGLLKMDFLGLKTLSIIMDAIHNIKLSKGIDLDINKIPLDDTKTYELYSAGDTTGLFQFESPGMKKHLRSLMPNRFEDLIAMNALYRPGPIEYIPSFIARKHGREPIVYDLPEMEGVLKETYGITVYQEQVMILSQVLADFTKGQADTLRKAMGKKQRAVLDKMKSTFIDGAVAKGHPEKVCEKIWTDWEAFAQYAFNKSHSTCYAYVSYQTAYLKAHYPEEFMAAVLSRNLSDIKKISFFMDECKRMGAAVLGPDVNYSYSRFAVDTHRNIRFGMAGIKGVGEGAVEAIVNERNAGGLFKDIYDFVERVNLTSVNKKAMECLVMSGAFDSLITEPRSVFFVAVGDGKNGGNFLEILLRYGNQVQADKKFSQNSLFGDLTSSSMIKKPEFPKLEEGQGQSKLEILNKERDMVGIYLSAHPLDDYRVIIEKYCTAKVAEMGNLEPLKGRDLLVGGMITKVVTLSTQDGKEYGRYTLEDFNGSHEFTLFSKQWEKFKYFIQMGNSVVVNLKVEENNYSKRVDIRTVSIKQLSEVAETAIKELTLAIPIELLTPEFTAELTEVIDENPGKIGITVAIKDPSEGIQATLRSRSKRVELSAAVVKHIEYLNLDYKIN
ncbi:MAG: DNA polymerase III subunit alpha [Rikenellaceae bacterium]